MIPLIKGTLEMTGGGRRSHGGRVGMGEGHVVFCVQHDAIHRCLTQSETQLRGQRIVGVRQKVLGLLGEGGTV